MGWMTPPDYGPCQDPNNYTVSNGQTLTLSSMPGGKVYCGKIRVTGGTLIFEPGLYILDGVPLTFSGGTVVGADVTFYLTENSTNSDDISIQAQSSVSLSAPDDGPLPNVLFFQDPDAPDTISHSFTGGATMDLVGIMYFPNQHVTFAGGSSSSLDQTILIADTLKFTGSSSFGGADSDDDDDGPLLTKITLVE